MKKSFILAALAMGLCLSSCTEKIELVYSDKPVTDVTLKAALEAKGVQFNEAGCILINEAAEAVTELDLSGKKVANFDGLEALENLASLNLSGNEYGPVFDLATLPAQVTSIDLTNNNISDFEGLVKVEIPEDGGDPVITNLRDIKKLYIPETMKDNYDDMVYFYLQNKKAIEDKTMDVKMADKEGKLNVYNTLRNVPDPELVKYLKHEFPEVMVGDQIDMAAHFKLGNATKALSIDPVGTGTACDVDVLDFEGIQYFAGNPNWKGSSIYITGLTEDDGMTPKSVMPTFPIGESVTHILFSSVIGGIDFSKASNLIQIQIICVNGMKEMDLTNASLWGTRKDEIELTSSNGSTLMLVMCADLEKIILPEAKDMKCFCFDVELCPKLKTLDISRFTKIGFGGLILSDLAENCALAYPTLDLYLKDGYVETNFACSPDVWAVQSTKDFIDKHYTKIEDPTKRIMMGSTMMSGNDFDWESEVSK